MGSPEEFAPAGDHSGPGWDAVAAEFGYAARIHHPLHRIEGVWWDGMRYHLVAPPTAKVERSILSDWVRDNKPMSLPLVLSQQVPPSAVKLEDQSPIDHAAGRGRIRNYRGLRDDLALRLPRSFPNFNIENDPKPLTLVLVSTRPLDEREREHLEALVRDLGLWVRWNFRTDPAAAVPAPPAPQPRKRGNDPHALDQVPSRFLPATLPAAIRGIIEEDEENWSAWGPACLTGDFAVLPAAKPDASSVLVDVETFRPPDLRNFLALYRRVVLPMPISERFRGALDGLGITERELIELFRRGRVDVLLPQPIGRYPLRVVAEMAEARPEGIVGSRTLALQSMHAVHERFPLAFVGGSLKEREVTLAVLRAFEDHLRTSAGAEHEFSARWTAALTSHLAFVWTDMAELLHRRGAMMVGTFGTAPVLADTYRRGGSTDAWLEFTTASRIVEYALAGGASVAPAESEYGHAEYVDTVAGVYSNRTGRAPSAPATLLPLADEVLAIARDVPVLELADAFGGAQIDRLRDLISNLAGMPPEDVRSAISAFNQEVKAYERRQARLAWWQISGLAFAAGAALVGDYTGGVAAETLRWGTERLLDSPWWDTTRTGSLVADALRGASVGARPRAVLVARMRRQAGG